MNANFTTADGAVLGNTAGSNGTMLDFGGAVDGPIIKDRLWFWGSGNRNKSASAFRISENESPRPVDRVFLTYNYFNNVAPVTGPGGDGVNLQGFIVNSHTGAVDLSVFGFDPVPINVAP